MIKIVGFGSPILDQTTSTSVELLHKYGLQTNNQVLGDDKYNPLYNELKGNKYEKEIGGACQNSIRVLQWMLQNTYPNCTSFIGAVGNDEEGREMELMMTETHGVHVDYMINESLKTGNCYAFVNPEGRALIANLNAASSYCVDHLKSNSASKILYEAHIVYVEGFFLSVSVETVLWTAKHTSENNKLFCLNLSAPFVIKSYINEIKLLLPHCQYLFGNDVEAMVLAEAMGWLTDSPSEAGPDKIYTLSEDRFLQIGRKICEMPMDCSNKHKNDGTTTNNYRVVAFTNGCLVCSNGYSKAIPIHYLPADEIVDSNSAGDAFVGGFLATVMTYLNRGLDIREPAHLDKCYAVGLYACGVILQHRGCNYPPICEYSIDV